VELPSESQWERAARHTDARIYPWNGDFAPDRCNISGTGIGATSAVGIFPGGHAECGAADMSGNVWDWCRTRWQENYEGYAKKVSDDLTGGERRVLRGGSWSGYSTFVRAAFRNRSEPGSRRSYVGFRLVAPGF
jgi:formylglycine-generating enzyme required for sulfatase activity